MDARTKKVVDALIQKIANHECELTMKADGETVQLEVNKNGSVYVWFSKVFTGATAHNLEEVAQWCIEYPKKADELLADEIAYKQENEPKLKEYFHKHIEGKTFDEISPDTWDWYSDWHKDVYGYRPHGIVCGEYINPHATKEVIEKVV